MEQLLGKTKTCKKCGFRAPEEWFVKNFGLPSKTKTYMNYRTICPMCLQEQRDRQKRADRAIVKARRMLYSHAKKREMKSKEFASTYGWNVLQMIHDINHNFENWCPYCRQAYADMGHGLRDLTLDIITPDEPPYYTNVRYCCSTCNSIKGQRGSKAFGLHLAMVKQRQEYLSASFGTLIKPQYKMELN